MLRTYRYPLRPTKAQAATLESWLGSCQRLYNAALEQRRFAWSQHRRGVTYNIQSGDLTALRVDGEYADVPVLVARSALRRLDHAFKAFFRRIKVGESPGYPRFKSQERFDSFAITGSGKRSPVRIEGNRLSVPKLGLVKFHRYRDFEGEVRHVKLKRKARGWVLCIVCDVGEAPPKATAEQALENAAGIDLGLTTFAMLDDGTPIANPRYYRKGEAVLARRQQSLTRKKRGSNSRREARQLVARAHEHVRNQRTDYFHKVAKALFAKYDLIAHEDLNIRGLAQGRLAKSVADASWGRFIQILTCKAESAGKWVVPVDPRGTSQRCSECGATVKKTLDERVHRCPDCGYTADRDVNAARNVLALGRSEAPQGRRAARLASPRLASPFGDLRSPCGVSAD